MIKISRDTDTKVAFSFQAYRTLSELKAELIFSEDVSIEIPSLSEDVVVTINHNDVSTLPLGNTPATLSVMKSNGECQVSYIVETEIVDGSVSGNEVVYLAVPNTINLPQGSGTIDDLINGRIKINQFLFKDTDDNEFIVTAIMDGGYPTLKVEKKS